MADPSTSELAERLARIEDERAIVARMYASGRAIDYGDRDLFLSCFTPDADYQVEKRISPDGNFSFHGHAGLVQFFDGHTHAPDAYHKHITVNPDVQCDGDTARASSYFMRVDARGDGPAIVLASGRYVGELVRGADGDWRIRTRRVEVENT